MIIKTKNLSYSYPIYDDKGNVSSQKTALDNVSLEISAGSFTAVLGHNGCGKSTFAKLLTGILLPDFGCVIIDDIEINADDIPCENSPDFALLEDKIYAIRQNAGMVFQNPDNQIIAAVVEEDVAFGLENLGVSREEIRYRIDVAMKTVGIYELRKRAPHHLSGGQKQRTAIAGVIAMRPKIIILDEPTAMLDPSGRSEVIKTILALCKEQGITIILITHYMEEASLADRVIVMSKGKVVRDNSPRVVFSEAVFIKSIGLDIPQVTEFSLYMKEKGYNDFSSDIITENDCKNVLKDFVLKHPPLKKTTIKTLSDSCLETAVRLENIVCKYGIGTPECVTALNKISVSFNKGEFIGIIGHTGSGKSTLVQTLNGLLKPGEGKIFIYEKDIWDKKNNIRDVRFKVGLVFQYSENQLFEETVFKDIAYGPKNMGLSEEEIKNRVITASQFMGVSKEWLEYSPFELSGGQQRRVALAGVIAMNPEILILDEPAAGLDPMGREKLFDSIKNYRKATGATIILVSHSMEDISRFADKVLVMNKGEVFLFDTVEEVFSHYDDISKIGLSLPQITRVFKELELDVSPLNPKDAAEFF